MSQQTCNKLDKLLAACLDNSEEIESNAELNEILLLNCSLLYRGAKKGLLDIAGITLTLDEIGSELCSLPAGSDLTGLNGETLIRGIRKRINNISQKEMSGWVSGKTSAEDSLLATRDVDISPVTLARLMPASKFCEYLAACGNNDGIKDYNKSFSEILAALKDKNYSKVKEIFNIHPHSGIINDGFPAALKYNEISNVIQLRGPEIGQENPEGWNNIHLPVFQHVSQKLPRGKMWVTHMGALQTCADDKCCPGCKSMGIACLRRLLCWFGLAHINTDEPCVVMKFKLLTQSQDSVGAVPNHFASGFASNLDEYRFFIPRNKIVNDVHGTSLESGITYDLETATTDSNDGAGLPEWILLSDYLELQSVWLALPSSDDTVCTFSGRNDDKNSYLQAAAEIGKTQVVDLLTDLRNFLKCQ